MLMCLLFKDHLTMVFYKTKCTIISVLVKKGLQLNTDAQSISKRLAKLFFKGKFVYY
jgi:hypothetical protein